MHAFWWRGVRRPCAPDPKWGEASMQRITAMSGGGFLMEDTPLLDDFMLSRARATT
jgi:hypothetical protein